MVKSVEISPDRLSPEVALPLIFDNPTVQAIHRKMFVIGTHQVRESAFAVYEKGSGIHVSKHLIPESRTSHNTERAKQDDHNSVDISSLIIASTPRARLVIQTADEIEEKLILGKFVATPELTALFTAVDRDDSFNEQEKLTMKANLALRQVKTERAISSAIHRSDLLLSSHNHPTSPFNGDFTAHSVLSPSSADVRMHTMVAATNAGFVESIVACDISRQKAGLFLFAAESNREQSVDGFGATSDGSRSREYNLRELGRHGYIFTTLALDQRGALLDGQEDNLRDFARQVKR